ncbi:MAG: UvrD-helicase domain-containing protein, partial [Abditibacteriota bacterium]|nr:UvrD-helicase domain-containing protein [Abditibacteriota bacterium]
MGWINYEASAGTGKTYTIQQIYADKIKGGMKTDGILVMTYTETAAGELRARIRGELEKRLEKEPGNDNYSAALRDLGDAWICTIHSFCRRVLAEYPVEAGLDLKVRPGNADASFEEGVSLAVRGLKEDSEKITALCKKYEYLLCRDIVRIPLVELHDKVYDKISV